MTIYFYSNEKNQTIGKEMIQHLKRSGAMVISNLLTSQSTGDLSLEEVDALIILGDELDANGSYFVAWALSQNKHILFLLSKQPSANQTLQTLKKNKNFSDKVNIVIYQPDDLQQILLDFLQKLDQDSGRDAVNIKYTLRISPKISDFLTWKAKHDEIRKADWLRKLITEMMQNDQAYQQFLNKKYKAQ